MEARRGFSSFLLTVTAGISLQFPQASVSDFCLRIPGDCLCYLLAVMVAEAYPNSPFIAMFFYLSHNSPTKVLKSKYGHSTASQGHSCCEAETLLPDLVPLFSVLVGFQKDGNPLHDFRLVFAVKLNV